MIAFSKCLSTQDVAVSSLHKSSNALIHCGGVYKKKSLCQHAVEVRVELHQRELCLTEFCIFLSSLFFKLQLRGRCVEDACKKLQTVSTSSNHLHVTLLKIKYIKCKEEVHFLDKMRLYCTT